MKRTILSILLLTACVCGAKAQSDTVYVYRNDGVISMFPKSGVDSIVCSQIDIDSLVHRDYVTMEVWTPEFIDRIPLEAVDSISFVYDKKNVACPDSNHPHAIDLGLPSGTRWCCCNVGAHYPELYGGYYAWGETEEKNDYSLDTYMLYDNDEFIYTGPDIAGTQYDVAHVRMGGSWQMPSNDQQNELISNCSHVFTQQNGVNGFLFTGINGNSIFLPAAGFKLFYNYENEGLYGLYWSCTAGSFFNAMSLDFGEGFWHWGNGFARVIGQTVRPVCTQASAVEPE